MQRIQSALELSAAVGRIRRESQNQSEASHSPGLVSALNFQQNQNLLGLDLFNSNPGRNSVINFRLPRHLSSSTPAVSPSASPSVSFRQISVIRSVSDCQDSVFDEDLPLQSQLPNTLTEMDDKEAEIQFMKDELETKRLCLPIRDVFMHNIADMYQGKILTPC